MTAITNINKVIYADCDGVLLNWINSAALYYAKYHKLKVKDVHWRGGLNDVYGITRDEASRLVAEFNTSDYVRNLAPFGDAVDYVKRLHAEYGYVLHVISSMGDSPGCHERRWQNLRDVFGSAVVGLDCVESSADKKSLLQKYYDIHQLVHPGQELFWIEDYEKNAKIGYDIGYTTFLMDQSYNQNANAEQQFGDTKASYHVRVSSWADIYDELTVYNPQQ